MVGSAGSIRIWITQFNIIYCLVFFIVMICCSIILKRRMDENFLGIGSHFWKQLALWEQRIQKTSFIVTIQEESTSLYKAKTSYTDSFFHLFHAHVLLLYSQGPSSIYATLDLICSINQLFLIDPLIHGNYEDPNTMLVWKLPFLSSVLQSFMLFTENLPKLWPL